jgi:hypothetical protein
VIRPRGRRLFADPRTGKRSGGNPLGHIHDSRCRIGEFDCMSGQLPHRFAAPDADRSCTGMKPTRSMGAGHAVDIDTLQQRGGQIVDQPQLTAGLKHLMYFDVDRRRRVVRSPVNADR